MTIQPTGRGGSPPGGGGRAPVPGQLDLIELLWGGPTPLVYRFRKFHEGHPEVYAALVRFTREAIARTGRRRVGIAAVYERARWELSLRTSGSPALNNSYKAFYARLIMAQEEDLQGVFETRASVADDSMGTAA
jgi:hypothetical protein